MADYGSGHAGRGASHVMYALYAVSLFTGLPMVIGVILAYVTRGGSHSLYRTHLTYGIRAFWWSVLGFLIGMLVWIIGLGWLVWGLVWIYVAWITARGWLRLFDDRPAPGFGT